MESVCCRGKGPFILSSSFFFSLQQTRLCNKVLPTLGLRRSFTHACEKRLCQRSRRGATPFLVFSRWNNPSSLCRSISQAHLRTWHCLLLNAASLGSTNALVIDRFWIFGAQLSGCTQTLALSLTQNAGLDVAGGILPECRSAPDTSARASQECARSFASQDSGRVQWDGPDGRVGFYECQATGNSWRGQPWTRWEYRHARVRLIRMTNLLRSLSRAMFDAAHPLPRRSRGVCLNFCSALTDTNPRPRPAPPPHPCPAVPRLVYHIFRYLA